MASIVFTAINTRSLANWSPVLRELERRGHEVGSLLFPHCADPDSAGLEDAASWCRPAGVFPLRESLWGAAPGTWMSVVAQALEPLRRIRPDAVLMTACHAGPEPELAVAWSGSGRRPVFIGCQHGFVQNWEGYWNNFSVDHLLVFGQMFRQLAPSRVAERVHVAGLAKLDSIVAVPRPAFADDRRPILFAGQRTCSEELVAMLRALRDQSGREVLVRHHPEHRAAFREADMPLLDHAESVVAQIARSALVVATGSTVVLEAMAAGAPVVALPLERGWMYADAGIVAKRVEAADVLALAGAHATAEMQALRRHFLINATGAERDGRVSLGADVIERLCGGHRGGEPELARGAVTAAVHYVPQSGRHRLVPCVDRCPEERAEPRGLAGDTWQPRPAATLQGPVVVGGVGGSGTRLIAQSLEVMGYHIGSDLNKSCDNLWFTLLFKRPEILGTSDAEFSGLTQLFARAMCDGGPFSDDDKATVRRLAEIPRDGHPVDWLRQRADALLSREGPGGPERAWGWKEPNTHLVLDRLSRVFAGMKFVLVSRHGLDMALSANQNQARLWGPILLDEPYVPTLRYSLRYWCAAHRRVLASAARLSQRFHWVKYDEYCRSPLEHAGALCEFLGFADSDALSRVVALVRPSASIGRAAGHSLDQFDQDDVAYVESLGFPIRDR